MAEPRVGERAAERAAEAAEKARLTFRRLAGLDRSGPPPPQTLKGQPLHPWTIPNVIGYIRLALIPVFLVLAISGTVFVVTDVLFEEWSAALVAALTAALFGWFWYGLPLLRRATSRR